MSSDLYAFSFTYRVYSLNNVIFRQGDNSLPTELRSRAVHRFIKAREREVQDILTRISDEKDQLEICNNAVFNLELALFEGKKIIKTNEDTLASLITIQSRLGEINSMMQKETKNEPTSKYIYADLRNYSEKPIMRMTNVIDEQLAPLRDEVRTLWDKVRQVEMELSGWMSSKRLSEAVIKRLNDNLFDIEKDLKVAKQAFQAIWRVPPDVWAKIFRYAIQQAQDEYLKRNPTDRGLRPPMFNISQVCHRWRDLVHNDPDSWTLVYVAPYSVWCQDEYDLVIKSVQKSSAPITILTNLLQKSRYNYRDNFHYDRSGNRLPCVEPNESTVFDGKDYTLFVIMDDDNPEPMERLESIPLRHASSLVFYGRNCFQYGYLSHHVSNFPNVKSFSIINEGSPYLPNEAISSFFPRLREFTLQVKAFPSNFHLRGYLSTTLYELRLYDNGRGALPILSSEVELPHLRLLEITSPGAYLLDRLTARALRSLTLSGPREYRGLQLSYSNKAIEIYSRLVHLRFQDWKHPDTPDGSLGVATLLTEIPILSSKDVVEGNHEPLRLELENRERISLARNRKKFKKKTGGGGSGNAPLVKAPVIESSEFTEKASSLHHLTSLVHGIATKSGCPIGKAPHLGTLTFSRCYVHGRTLISAVETITTGIEDLENRSSLKEIVLEYPTGITNSECEELRKSVNNVKIYM
jgi:hypothetical protein